MKPPETSSERAPLAVIVCTNCRAPGVEAHAFLAALIKRGDGQALQQRDAGLQGAGKIQLAAHRPLR